MNARFGHETRHMISGCIAPLFGVRTPDPPEATGGGSSSSDIPFGLLSPEHIAVVFIARTPPG